MLPQNSFVKGASILVGGTAFSQLILIAASPILTRLYSPDDFGVLSVYVSILAIILIVSSLRYDLAIPLPDKNEDAYHLVILSLLITLTFSLLLCLVIFLYKDNIFGFLENTGIKEFIWFLPLGIIIGGSYLIFLQWSVREKLFKSISISKFWQAISTVSIQIFLYPLGVISLIGGHVVGQFFGFLRLFTTKRIRIDPKRIIQLARENYRFPFFSAPAGLLRVTGKQMTPIVLAAIFNPVAAGLYALTLRVLIMPASLIGGAVGQVFYSDARRAHKDGSLKDLVRQIHLNLSKISLPFSIFLILTGPYLFSFIFGNQWSDSGVFAGILAPWIYLEFVSSPITTLTAVLNKQREGLIFHIILFLLRVTALYFGYVVDDLILTIIYLSIANTLWRFIFLLWLFKLSGNRISTLFIDSIRSLISSVVLLLPILISTYVFQNYLVFGYALSFLMAVIYYTKLLRKAY